MLGRAIFDVILIYATQSNTFHNLSMNAANLYRFIPEHFYLPVVVLGIVFSGFVGLGYSMVVARGKVELTVGDIVLAATVSLQLMPWALPKMHDRYFYAFEVMMVILACMEPPLAFVAMVTQANAILAYFSFDGRTTLGVPLAAQLNTLVLALLAVRLWNALRQPAEPPAFTLSDFDHCFTAISIAYVLWIGTLIIILPTVEIDRRWPIERSDLTGLALYGAILLLTLAIQRRLRSR